MIYFAIFFSFLISLFSLYLLSKHDFVLLRKNIAVTKIFDVVIISILVGGFVSRVFFAIDETRLLLFNIIPFFHIIRYPGLSLLGFVLGAVVTIVFFLRKTKAMLRILDIYTISFFPIAIAVVATRGYFFNIFFQIIIIFLSITYWLYIIRSHSRYALRDGSLSCLSLALISFDCFSYAFITGGRNIVLGLSFSQIVSLPLGIFALFLFFANQHKIINK